MKKFLLTLGFILGLGLTNAHAVPVTINFDEFYDWGRLYSYNAGTTSYVTTNSNPAPFGPDTAVGTSVAANVAGQANGTEDTWGVGQVSSITNAINTSDKIWERNAGQELTFMFSGYDDDQLNHLSSSLTELLSVGGGIQVYLDTTPDFNGALGTAGRTGAQGYTGATDGVLALDLVPVVQDADGHTLESIFNFNNLSGSGTIFLDVSGNGAWDSQYDTNTICINDFDASTCGHDFKITYTVRSNSGGVIIADWVVRGDAGGEANVIPEPATMALLGTGLAGLLARRRKQQA